MGFSDGTAAARSVVVVVVVVPTGLGRDRQIERIVFETVHQGLDVVGRVRALQGSSLFVSAMTPFSRGTLLLGMRVCHLVRQQVENEV